VKHLRGAPPWGRLLASPTNIRRSWRGLPEANTLAYYENKQITAVKGFIVQAPGGQNSIQYLDVDCFFEAPED
jgi:hypothetical protein